MNSLRHSAAVTALLGLSVLGCEDATNPLKVPLSQQSGRIEPGLATTDLLHTYSNSLGHEVAHLIPISASKLLPLLPAGYDIVPAAALGLGSPSDGVVVIANFRGVDQSVDATIPSETTSAFGWLSSWPNLPRPWRLA
jgi:hypothetical protein